MTKMPRVANCDYNVDGCDDPRCKVTFCIQREEELAQQAADALADAQELQSHAKRLARLILNRRGIADPTEAQIVKVAKHEEVQTTAKAQIEMMKKAFPQFHR